MIRLWYRARELSLISALGELFQQVDVGTQPGRVLQLHVLRAGDQRLLAEVGLRRRRRQRQRARAAVRGGHRVPGARVKPVPGAEHAFQRLQGVLGG